MSDISKKVIGEIHEKNIKPLSKRYFVVRSTAVWLSLLASVILGGIAVSTEDMFLERANGLINWVSLFLVFSVFLFMTLAYLNVRSTGDGYRYRTVWVVISIILIFIALAVLFRQEGIGDRVESRFDSHCPAISQYCPDRY
ncbi:MAG: hypothetical protein M1361_00465 [Patescibacteria group bacterium]|nr:hypothetical protein [Patescibacteria group bacterium]MCL5224088.1 hypothetical protein [Patescibacteria group bacterium]